MSLLKNKRRINLRQLKYGNSETRVAVTILLFVICSWSVPAQENIQFRVACWNTENLFDTRHDSLKNDYEFLPNAIRHWNYNKYKKKLSDIARVITAIGEWNPPALIGLCEVENDTVLRDLTHRSPLQELDYRYVMTDSPDLRGIDMALLYQRDLFKLLSSRSISIPVFRQHRPTRNLLHVNGLLLTGDTLDVFVCHLPSRSGGAKESEPYRLHAAQILRTKVDSVLHTRLHPQVIKNLVDVVLMKDTSKRIIVMGDFNDYPNNKSIRKILEAEAPPIRSDSLDIAIHPATSPSSLSPLKLYHLLARKATSRHFGSYKYHGEWGLLDHLIVSGNLLDASSKFFTGEDKANVARLPFLLTEDKKYGDDEPFRTYKGMKYQGGFSDHLPIYTDFELVLP